MAEKVGKVIVIESSSDDDENGRRPAKLLSLKRPRDVHWVSLNNNSGDEIPATKVANRTPSGGQRRKFPGAYPRKSGRWSSEIKEPFTNRRIWLGTFDTPEEASNAFAAKKLEFRERKEAQSGMNPSRPECESGRSEEQIDAGQNQEPILIDSNEFLLGEISNLDDGLTVLNKFTGTYRRKSGRWSAEIRDPFIKRRIRLGTFDTPEEASNAYAAKKLEFRQRKETKSYMDSTRPEYDSGRSGEQIDARREWEPILIDSNGFLLGEFSNLDDDLRIS